MGELDIREAVEMDEGAGARVRRLFPLPGFMNFDPFVLWDHFRLGPAAGFPPHPHRGFEAITYLFRGGMRHEDNLGNRSTVGAGGAQRFTAGKGLVHSEMPAPGGETEGIQLWINLPKRLKTLAPAYQPVDAAELPELTLPNGRARLIVGPGSSVALHTPVRYVDVQLDSGSYDDEIAAGYRGLIYVAAGALRVGEESVATGQACFVTGPRSIRITAETPSRFLLCVGTPHGEPIRQHGPYVD